MRGAVRIGLVVTIAFATVPAWAKPYEDTQGRFRIEVPEGWNYEPRFGDTQGMTFRKEVSGHGSVTVDAHIDPIEAASLRAFVDKITADLEKTHARLDKRLTDVGGKHALLIEYGPIDKDKAEDPLGRLREYFLEASGHHYELRVEGQLNSLRRVEKELESILKSFVPKAGAQHEVAERPADKPFEPALLIGRWMNDDKLVMVIHADGGFLLGETKGRYEIVGHTLTFILPGQGREDFNFTVDESSSVITLSSPNLETPMSYRRLKDDEGDEPVPAAARPGLPGRWQTKGLLLELKSGGEFTMGKMRGTWSAEGDRLTLRGTHGESVSYQFELHGDSLRLSGGDLDDPRTFRKAPGR
jgi:hypothetical protein